MSRFFVVILFVLTIFIGFVEMKKVKKYDFRRLVTVILSQNHSRHRSMADTTKSAFVKSLKKFGVKKPNVLTLHKDLNIHGGWAVTPLMPRLVEETHPGTEWFLFLDEASVVNVTVLNDILVSREAFGDFFIGHELKDTNITALHHFYSHELTYPDFSAGFLLSRSLVKYLAKEMSKGPFVLKGMPIDHTIDAAFELAKTIEWLEPREPRYGIKPRIKLENEPRFCTKKAPGCAVYPRDTSCHVTKEASAKLLDETLFAVKTCQDNHEKRLTTVKKTWAPFTKNIIYVSEEEDPAFGTTVLPGADFNTILGHCNKTEAILRYFANNNNNWRWLVIADDDTMLSVGKIMDAIQCYDKNRDEKIALGERFGFRINGPGKKPGADFPVGGSSMVFNLPLAKLMVDPNHDLCTCEHPGYPDDIHLGECLFRLNVPIVHHKEFHQVRPKDYNQDRLSRQGALSFHRFQEDDPKETYDTWFRSYDEEFWKLVETLEKNHDEL